MRVAFIVSGGAAYWTGGFNYLVNTFRVLRHFPECGLTPVVFASPELPESDLKLLNAELNEPVRVCSWLSPTRRSARMLASLLRGIDVVAQREFARSGIDEIGRAHV